MRLRRFAFRRLGLGDGLNELERRMGLLNLAVATETSLLLFRLRIEPPNASPLEIDLAASPDATALLRHLDSA